jgi:hypothetical protein
MPKCVLCGVQTQLNRDEAPICPACTDARRKQKELAPPPVCKQVVRCSVCTRVHDLRDLLDIQHLANGMTTFTCPVRMNRGVYALESVGTLSR